MLATIQHKTKTVKINLHQPLDISMPLKGDTSNVNAWYVKHPMIEAHRDGKFIGKVTEGSSTNFNNISFNPHAHGTHTECLGHITEEFYSVNEQLKQFFFLAELITVAPEELGEDFIISKKQLQYALGNKKREALVIRTLPNLEDKKSKQYSNTNPPYLTEESVLFLVGKGIQHLLIDLPSVDKEKDGGALAVHKAFWNITGEARKQATITELIYVNNTIEDGTYMLDLQMAPFHNDASPSKPILYKVITP
ncbi:cyclase family protein [uncultured Maribacter sp.]|uniref:cyclase family protein n=1 Tax=uncultured Maribacter sp. TaxID=431308 RepID=UPI002638F347|nr:cyclase family protein [uncultured Maribacter sp.]